MLDSIAYYLVKGLNKLLHVLPMGAALALGRFGGHVVYLLSGKRKRITYANLKAAFFAEKSPRELAMITKNVYLNVGQVFGELLALTKTDKEYYDKYIKVHNFDRILEASKNPNGMILVSAHFGNWELVSAKAFTVGIPLHLLARDQKMAKLNELLNQLRESKGSKVVRKGMDVKKVFRILRSGGSLGLLGDQNAGVNGVLVDFFGRPASAAVGPYRFGQKSGAWVVPAFVYRTKGQYHEVVIEEPMKIEQGMDIEPFIKKYNECLEKQIRINPGQWFWMHKRWKATTMKKILVLDDGKKGHLKQSLSVVREIRRYRRDKGLDDSQTPVEIVKVIFKGRFHRTLLAAVSPFIAKYSQGSLSWLKWALDAESHKRLESLYADIIVSAGSALAGVNLIMKCENNARSVAVLDPGPMKRKKFDIVVVPAHDALKFKPADNTVVTELAPNL
ncbi:MAG: ELM1/GtrOC1 family putative glycosyltransferase [Candidatus Omnitrophica bacterium]|nr:ELM1/GtrOC1 family putative glycosyltransferase [Candidatus Omnitrophota bacterium]